MKRKNRDKMFFGSTTVGDRGQITIPKEARSRFDINPGDKILVFGDLSKGIGLIKATELEEFASKFLESFDFLKKNENDNERNESKQIRFQIDDILF
jgi:AbrB family looped-hinge helix DNA binding protein